MSGMYFATPLYSRAAENEEVLEEDEKISGVEVAYDIDTDEIIFFPMLNFTMPQHYEITRKGYIFNDPQIKSRLVTEAELKQIVRRHYQLFSNMRKELGTVYYHE